MNNPRREQNRSFLKLQNSIIGFVFRYCINLRKTILRPGFPRETYIIRCLAPYDHFEIRTSLGTQVALLAIIQSESQSTKFANILDLIGTLWETFCSRSISNPIQVWVVFLGSLVFGKCIFACISQLRPGWPDLSLPMDQHHSSLPHGRKLLRILSFSFLPTHRLIITI